MNVVGNDEIERGLANGITEPECVSGAAIARGLSVGSGGRALVRGEDFEDIRAMRRCKTIASACSAYVRDVNGCARLTLVSNVTTPGWLVVTMSIDHECN